MILASAADAFVGLGALGGIIAFLYGVILLIFPFWVIIRLDAIHKEARIQNKLTRQLLKAYGHEPEA